MPDGRLCPFLHAFDQFDKGGLEEAANNFQQALALEPSFIRAAESLALTHFVQADNTYVPAANGFERARTDAKRLILMNPRSEMGHEWTKLKEPDEVATAVESALFEPKPKRRYMVVPNQGQAEDTIKAQIEQLVQLNEGQRYTYDRPTLIKMLDAALVGARPRSK